MSCHAQVLVWTVFTGVLFVSVGFRMKTFVLANFTMQNVLRSVGGSVDTKSPENPIIVGPNQVVTNDCLSNPLNLEHVKKY